MTNGPHEQQPYEQSEPSPQLSLPALHELRRIYCKHLIEVFATPETQELYDRGCITGQFRPSRAAAHCFVVEAVTATGLAALESRERESSTS